LRGVGDRRRRAGVSAGWPGIVTWPRSTIWTPTIARMSVGFPGAARAKQPRHPAGRNQRRDARQDRLAAAADAQVADLDCRLTGVLP
jgi:hypothetical protein